MVAAAALGLIGGGTLLLGGTPAQAADNPTATVSGGCLTILACNMKFSSAQFTVPSGGQLVVKNSMNGLLNGPVTVSVGDQRKTIGSGGTATFSFSQSVDQQSYSMSAASALINSGAASQVMVAPMVKQPTQPSTPPASAPPASGGSTPGTGSTGSSTGGGVQAPSLPHGGAPQGQPPALLPPGLTGLPTNPAARPLQQPALPNGADGNSTPSGNVAGAGSTPNDPTATGRSTSDTPGPLTLLVLVAGVVVAGVGSAVIRTMMGARGRMRALTH
ncbi:hypothetical protein GCM10009765_29410 [Fodinicola feengrottensis]|uniref:Uncharacterized protein n=1 Tax=Fodinicola feengrottensis TaxID=435914 RepID=A0ABP4SU28_9ACTN